MAESDETPGGGGEAPGTGEVTIEFVEHAEGPHEVPPDYGTTGAQVPAPPESEESRAQQLEAQLLRLRADFENFRKRTERDRAEAGDRAQAELLKEILPVLDNMDRALALLEQEAPPEWCRGMELVHQSFVEALARAGAEPIEAKGAPFDPAFHEAVTLCRDEGVPDGAVADVLLRGYRFRGRLLRPARVRVNRLTEDPQEDKGNG